MPPRHPALDADWLGACRRAASGVRTMLAEHPTTAARAQETGLGGGGDRTLVIDREAERLVFAELDRLAEAGHAFTAISEERGEVGYGDGAVRVIIDPIDGSLNAKRGIPHHALSIAVADGTTMADVAFAFVHDYGPGEEWTATRGAGAQLDGRSLPRDVPERRSSDGRLEVLGIESADPRWVAGAANALGEVTYRLRAVGAIAISLCQVAAARFDGMLSLRASRAVDAAAAQLIVREAGGHVGFPGAAGDLLGAPLDLEPHAPVVAARTPEGLRTLLELVS